MVNRNSDYMRLDDDWIWNFDWNVNGIWNLNFFNDWNFNLLIDWELLGVVMMNGMNLVRYFDLDGFAVKEIKFTVNEAVCNFRNDLNLLSASMPTRQSGLCHQCYQYQ